MGYYGRPAGYRPAEGVHAPIAAHAAGSTSAAPPVPPGSSIVPPGSSGSSSSDSLHLLRVLVVDDSPTVLKFLGKNLSKCGYAVTLAESGQRALQILTEAEEARSREESSRLASYVTGGGGASTGASVTAGASSPVSAAPPPPAPSSAGGKMSVTAMLAARSSSAPAPAPAPLQQQPPQPPASPVPAALPLFDLMLCDIVMPVMSGQEVISQIKAGPPSWRDIPIIIMSSLNDAETTMECLKLGADDVLTKPFNMEVVKTRVNACLERVRLRSWVQSKLGALVQADSSSSSSASSSSTAAAVAAAVPSSGANAAGRPPTTASTTLSGGGSGSAFGSAGGGAFRGVIAPSGVASHDNSGGIYGSASGRRSSGGNGGAATPTMSGAEMERIIAERVAEASRKYEKQAAKSAARVKTLEDSLADMQRTLRQVTQENRQLKKQATRLYDHERELLSSLRMSQLRVRKLLQEASSHGYVPEFYTPSPFISPLLAASSATAAAAAASADASASTAIVLHSDSAGSAGSAAAASSGTDSVDALLPSLASLSFQQQSPARIMDGPRAVLLELTVLDAQEESYYLRAIGVVEQAAATAGVGGAVVASSSAIGGVPPMPNAGGGVTLSIRTQHKNFQVGTPSAAPAPLPASSASSTGSETLKPLPTLTLTRDSPDFAKLSREVCGYPPYFTSLLFDRVYRTKLASMALDGLHRQQNWAEGSAVVRKTVADVPPALLLPKEQQDYIASLAVPGDATVTVADFIVFWAAGGSSAALAAARGSDRVGKFWHLVCGRRQNAFLTPADVRPLVDALVDFHPDLQKLRGDRLMRNSYVSVVLDSVFCSLHGQRSSKISYTEIRGSNLVDAFYLVAAQTTRHVLPFSIVYFEDMFAQYQRARDASRGFIAAMLREAEDALVALYDNHKEGGGVLTPASFDRKRQKLEQNVAWLRASLQCRASSSSTPSGSDNEGNSKSSSSSSGTINFNRGSGSAEDFVSFEAGKALARAVAIMNGATDEQSISGAFAGAGGDESFPLPAGLITMTALQQNREPALTPFVLSRIFSSIPRSLASAVPNTMTFDDFVWFWLAEKDRMGDTSVTYWFRCLDVDEDGFLSVEDLRFAYVKKLEAQQQAAAPQQATSMAGLSAPSPPAVPPSSSASIPQPAKLSIHASLSSTLPNAQQHDEAGEPVGAPSLLSPPATGDGIVPLAPVPINNDPHSGLITSKHSAAAALSSPDDSELPEGSEANMAGTAAAAARAYAFSLGTMDPPNRRGTPPRRTPPPSASPLLLAAPTESAAAGGRKSSTSPTPVAGIATGGGEMTASAKRLAAGTGGGPITGRLSGAASPLNAAALSVLSPINVGAVSQGVASPEVLEKHLLQGISLGGSSAAPLTPQQQPSHQHEQGRFGSAGNTPMPMLQQHHHNGPAAAFSSSPVDNLSSPTPPPPQLMASLTADNGDAPAAAKAAASTNGANGYSPRPGGSPAPQASQQSQAAPSSSIIVTNGVGSLYSIMCSVVDYINPSVPGRITTLDIKRSGAGPALFDVLIAMGQQQPQSAAASASSKGPKGGLNATGASADEVAVPHGGAASPVAFSSPAGVQ